MAAVSVRLPDDITNRLEKLALATGRTKTFYIAEAVREHLDDLEDIYLAEQVVEDLQAGKTYTVPLDQALKELGIDGLGH